MSETAINSEINYPGHKTVVVWLLAWHSTDNTGELRETSTIVRLKWVKFQVYSFRPADFFIVCRCGRKTQLLSISSFFSHPEPRAWERAYSSRAVGTWSIDRSREIDSRLSRHKTLCRVGKKEEERRRLAFELSCVGVAIRHNLYFFIFSIKLVWLAIELIVEK